MNETGDIFGFLGKIRNSSRPEPCTEIISEKGRVVRLEHHNYMGNPLSIEDRKDMTVEKIEAAESIVKERRQKEAEIDANRAENI